MSQPTRALGASELGRWAWGQLTSMRTALLLLFLLALATIPGSMIPQQSASPISVLDFKRANPFWDRIFEPLGFYDIYTSPGFSAVYLLLFISLIGCILPRIAKYFRAVRKPPPALPARVERLPVSESGAVGAAGPALDRAEKWLAARRYRTRRSPDGVSAERGYSREAGNLVFHVSLVFILLGMAWSNLWGYHGSVVVVEGRGFANVITQFDDFTAGGLLDTDSLEPFSVDINTFTAEFETGEVQRGAARRFDADVTLHDAAGSRDELLTVNEPLLTSGGTQVNLIGHGYAPSFTVRDGNGDVAFSGPVVFLPQDGNFASIGVIKVPDARPYRLAFEAYFFPTAVLGEQGPQSVFPDALSPEVYLNAWMGEPGVETGIPESIYTLNTDELTQIEGDGGEVLSARMLPGAGFALPDGLGSISFDGWQRWVKLQVSETPGNAMMLISLAIGVAGLCVSLYVRPRRLFVRIADGTATAGGLDRADAASGLEEQVADLLQVTVGGTADPIGSGHREDSGHNVPGHTDSGHAGGAPGARRKETHDAV
ncbi:cytochrome C biogenesis protein [Tessaracoccus flavus]|uniref:Cytochrome C biogenesis protein n=1 Tax=Tessaracoccus flavus TaxID=1610493 RepID=A0A1Q2CC52_9ACTN|nr:cytochrome c biogenesis protein ResB [Tessaracoccus flavus]AQP43684.1 cytochrome C biogenesis protein [Tessaracoccus flavus]SDZ02674.1 cytochrome c biogenesis protein [Tessaracoccus flavus]